MNIKDTHTSLLYIHTSMKNIYICNNKYATNKQKDTVHSVRKKVIVHNLSNKPQKHRKRMKY